MTVKPISLEPFKLADKRSSPCSTWSIIFSKTYTTASLIINPKTNTNPIKERLSKLNPHKYINPKAETTETGSGNIIANTVGQ